MKNDLAENKRDPGPIKYEYITYGQIGTSTVNATEIKTTLPEEYLIDPEYAFKYSYGQPFVGTPQVLGLGNYQVHDIFLGGINSGSCEPEMKNKEKRKVLHSLFDKENKRLYTLEEENNLLSIYREEDGERKCIGTMGFEHFIMNFSMIDILK